MSVPQLLFYSSRHNKKWSSSTRELQRIFIVIVPQSNTLEQIRPSVQVRITENTKEVGGPGVQIELGVSGELR